MRHQYPQWDMHSGDQDIPARDFYKHAALLVLKHAESRWQQRPRDDIAGDYPAQVEPADYFIRGADLPDFVLTDKRLQNFFRRNNIQLSKYGIQDVNQGRAELVRRGLTPRPTR
jgi:hypothetical protein